MKLPKKNHAGFSRAKILTPFKGTAGATQAGMTIIEILIVIALIGTIMTIIMTNVLSKSDDAKADLTRIGLKKLSENILYFKKDLNRVPTTEENLAYLIENVAQTNRWRGPYTETDKLKDAWGNAIQYEAKDRIHYVLISAGLDGEPGTEDDIKYPEEKAAAEDQPPISFELQVPIEKSDAK